MEQYWKAVSENDVETLKELLAEDPTLVHLRYLGTAWTFTESYGEVGENELSNTALHTASVNLS